MTQSAHMRSEPKQERGEQRMQRLLDAAEQIFVERGYKAATTNEIAARAQTSSGTLYRFFLNKEAIVQHLKALDEAFSSPQCGNVPSLRRDFFADQAGFPLSGFLLCTILPGTDHQRVKNESLPLPGTDRPTRRVMRLFQWAVRT